MKKGTVLSVIIIIILICLCLYKNNADQRLYKNEHALLLLIEQNEEIIDSIIGSNADKDEVCASLYNFLNESSISVCYVQFDDYDFCKGYFICTEYGLVSRSGFFLSLDPILRVPLHYPMRIMVLESFDSFYLYQEDVWIG